MTSIVNSRSLYKLIMAIFLLAALLKLKTQFVTLNQYNKEISTLNEKIAALEDNSNDSTSANSKEENEDIARKDLKMYYPNETPYKGY